MTALSGSEVCVAAVHGSGLKMETPSSGGNHYCTQTDWHVMFSCWRIIWVEEWRTDEKSQCCRVSINFCSNELVGVWFMFVSLVLNQFEKPLIKHLHFALVVSKDLISSNDNNNNNNNNNITFFNLWNIVSWFLWEFWLEVYMQESQLKIFILSPFKTEITRIFIKYIRAFFSKTIGKAQSKWNNLCI